jgi:hypothetical protein
VCRLQRQTGAIFPSSGGQQEQPFVQVRAEYSVSSKRREWHRCTFWIGFRMNS